MNGLRLPPETAVPRLARGTRLVHDVARGRWVLLAPETVVELDDVAHEILARVNGAANLRQIAVALSGIFAGDPATVDTDLREFVADLESRRLVEL